MGPAERVEQHGQRQPRRRAARVERSRAPPPPAHRDGGCEEDGARREEGEAGERGRVEERAGVRARRPQAREDAPGGDRVREPRRPHDDVVRRVREEGALLWPRRRPASRPRPARPGRPPSQPPRVGCARPAARSSTTGVAFNAAAAANSAGRARTARARAHGRPRPAAPRARSTTGPFSRQCSAGGHSGSSAASKAKRQAAAGPRAPTGTRATRRARRAPPETGAPTREPPRATAATRTAAPATGPAAGGCSKDHRAARRAARPGGRRARCLRRRSAAGGGRPRGARRDIVAHEVGGVARAHDGVGQGRDAGRQPATGDQDQRGERASSEHRSPSGPR